MKKVINIFLFLLLALVLTIGLLFLGQNTSLDENSRFNIYNEADFNNLRLSLMNDEDFIRLATMNYLPNDLLSMINNLVINMSEEAFNVINGEYRMSRREFNTAFRELYGSSPNNINFNQINYIDERGNYLYFDLSYINPNDNLIFIGVRSLEERQGILIANIDIYQIYINDFEEERRISEEIRLYLARNYYLSEEFLNNYGIFSENRDLIFKEQTNARYFRYQILSEVNGASLWELTEDGYLGANTLIAIYLIAFSILILIILGILSKFRNSNL